MSGTTEGPPNNHRQTARNRQEAFNSPRTNRASPPCVEVQQITPLMCQNAFVSALENPQRLRWHVSVRCLRRRRYRGHSLVAGAARSRSRKIVRTAWAVHQSNRPTSVLQQPPPPFPSLPPQLFYFRFRLAAPPDRAFLRATNPSRNRGSAEREESTCPSSLHDVVNFSQRLTWYYFSIQ